MFRILALLFLISTPAFAQDYKPYSEKPDKGEYIVLVTSQSCAPCQTLKRRLLGYPKSTIYIVDSDLDPRTANEVRQGYSFVPYFVKFRVNGFVNREVLENAAVANDAALASFMLVQTPQDVTPIQQQPIGNPLENLFSKRFDKLDKNNESLTESFQSLLIRVTLFERLQQKFSDLQEGFSNLNKNQNRLEELFNKFQDSRPVLDELAKARQERQGIFSKINEVHGMFSGLRESLDKLSQFGVGFETIRSDIREFKTERQGILATLKNNIDEVREVRGGIFDLRERFEKSDTESRKERERIRPLVNLIERLQGGVDAVVGFVTQSILMILLSIFGIFLALFLLIIFIVGALAVAFKALKWLATKLGLAWLFA